MVIWSNIIFSCSFVLMKDLTFPQMQATIQLKTSYLFHFLWQSNTALHKIVTILLDHPRINTDTLINVNKWSVAAWPARETVPQPLYVWTPYGARAPFRDVRTVRQSQRCRVCTILTTSEGLSWQTNYFLACSDPSVTVSTTGLVCDHVLKNSTF